MRDIKQSGINAALNECDRLRALTQQRAEREECAKVCYEHAMEAWDHEGGSLWCAAAIRNKEK
jgi:hypothetical protein